MSRQALIIIDMLEDFVREGGALEVPAARGIIPAVKKARDEARGAESPVIYVCDAHDPDDREFAIWPRHCVDNTPGAAVIEELAPRPDDIIIKKKTYSGFYETALDETLKRLGIDEIVLTGVCTNICVLYTASEATLRGYSVTVLKDAVAGLTEDDHNFALRQMSRVLKAEVR